MSAVRFTEDDERVLYHATLGAAKAWLDTGVELPAMESAGPRKKLFFDPSTLACGIVTCGGLCPGMNDVIRVDGPEPAPPLRRRKIYGFRFGYEGLVRPLRARAARIDPRRCIASTRAAARFSARRAGPRTRGTWSRT